MTGEDIIDRLNEVDENYYIMPKIGDWAEVIFIVPEIPNDSNLIRTIFLSTTGYYEVQIDKSQPEKKELISLLLNEPGMITDYAIDKFFEWEENHK